MLKTLKEYLIKHPYIFYSLVFILIFTLGQIPFQIKDGSFSLKGFFSEPSLFFDALKQHMLFLYDFVSKIKGFLFAGESFPVYSYDIGFGGDFLYSYAFYSIFDPLTIIAYIIPIKYIGLSYFLMMVIRLYLSGLFMMILGKTLGIQKPTSLIIIGLVYAFSFPMMYSVYRHAFFINGPMYLPLLMIGAERIIHKKSPLLFIVSVFLAAISQFYFFVYILVGFSVYWIFRIYGKHESKNHILFLKVIIYGFIGVLMAAFVLLPTFIQLVEGSRSASKGFDVFNFYELHTIIRSHLIPLRGVKYSIGIGNIILLLTGFMFFYHKDSKYPFIKWSFIIFLILSISSSFGFLLNGFTYTNQRWLFIIMVPLVLGFGFIIDEAILIEKSTKQKAISAVLTILMLTLFLILTTIEFKSPVMNIFYFVILFFVFVFLTTYLCQDKFTQRIALIVNVKNLKYLVLIFMVYTVFHYGFYYAKMNTPKDGFNDYYPNVELFEDYFPKDSFYRVEQQMYDGGFDKYSNDSLRYNYYSTHLYNSMANGYIGEYINALEIINLNGTTGYNGLERRSLLMSVNQVKYVLIRESEKTLPPYGFILVDTLSVPQYSNESMAILGKDFLRERGQVVYEDLYVYENQYFVDFAYMLYDTYNLDDFNGLDYLSKQEVLLDYVVLENGQNQNSSHQVDFVEVLDFAIIDQEKYTFTVPEIQNQEVYLYIEAIIKDDHDEVYEIVFETKDVRLRDTSSPYGTNTYKENKTHLVNLGYYENQENLEVNIYFDPGTYYIVNISYALLDMDNIDQKLLNLNQETLDDIEFNNQGFTGNITAKDDGYLMVSLPYSKAFKAYVDDKEVDIHRANIGFMSIEIPKGNHQIEFVYQTRGLTLGLILSLSGFILLIGTIIIDYKISKKENI
ncbi:YfhO family protein [Hujiaoplasma nucleasis]|uniref:YfhO family protein n=1 Tax=Hujiaoplasma nucleasis TaxID=2725268 RepID=A0A7L6N824_9MOLU|nr:YfhO family protein [Hujiaoplasma nucleasis]QLY40679.1 YfhO family protein [Hujiaoplasma nucleasis]